MTSGWLQDDFRMTSGWLQVYFRLNQRALSKHSESTKKALREYLKSTQREREQSDFVIPSEPKILRLVRLENILSFNGKGILLIRNPFKAIQSWYRHLQKGVHSDTEYKDQEQGIFLTNVS